MWVICSLPLSLSPLTGSIDGGASDLFVQQGDRGASGSLYQQQSADPGYTQTSTTA